MRVLTIYDFSKKKQRGQKSKLHSLLKYIDEFQAYEFLTDRFDAFRVPCASEFINSCKTDSKIKTEFCRKWIETTERFIAQKPSELAFCKVAAFISVPYFWNSQIIIFYDEDYYNSFRNFEKRQTFTEDCSFVRERGIVTNLKEIGVEDIFIDEDDGYICKSHDWWYFEE